MNNEEWDYSDRPEEEGYYLVTWTRNRDGVLQTIVSELWYENGVGWFTDRGYMKPHKDFQPYRTLHELRGFVIAWMPMPESAPLR